MRSAVILVVILLGAAAAVFALEMRGAQAATHVDVTLTEYRIRTTSTDIPAGVPVTFAVTNNGQTMHEVVLEQAGAVDQPLEMNGAEAEIDDIAPGETKSATWTFTQPGVYQLACHVPGHFEAGMVQQVTVTSATGSEGGLIAAPLQVAAPAEEDVGEHENRPSAGSAVTLAVTMPATLPAAGSTAALWPLWWLAVAIAIPIVAAYGAFRLIVRQIQPSE